MTGAKRPNRGEAPAGEAPQGGATGVAAYKAILQRVLDNRPSGTRLRLAAALGKNRSFVSQITNPSYAVPLPVRHVHAVLDACHLSQSERDAFMHAYALAHPERRASLSGPRPTRAVTLTVPDLGDARRNRAFDELLKDVAERLARYGASDR